MKHIKLMGSSGKLPAAFHQVFVLFKRAEVSLYIFFLLFSLYFLVVFGLVFLLE